jgi:actin-related protein 5
MVARYRDKKYGRQVLLFGKDVETDSGAKGNIRQMFDGDLLVQQDILVSSRRGVQRTSRRT